MTFFEGIFDTVITSLVIHKGMRRRIYDDLLRWKGDPDRKPLILEGVRQCGKTYILREFGRREFDSVAYLNLERGESFRDLFDGELDPHRIIREVGKALSKRMVPGRTLLILDEIQACPRALTSLKYFCEEAPEFHVACAGSLLGVLTASGESYPVGKVDHLRMFPMSFSEFVDACGERELSGTLLSMRAGDVPEGPARDRLETLLREYCVVGGLPEAVVSWAGHRNGAAVTRILKGILRDYMADFSKHASEDISALTDVWNSIPMQIARDNRKFMFGHVREGGRASNLSDALQWIVNAGLAYKVPLVESPGIPLKSACDESSFKVYLCDVGLLRVMSGRRADFGRTDGDGLYTGAMTENLVLCQMMSGGLEGAFYWRDGGTNEVDFLLDGGDGPVPLEVKSGDGRRSASLSAYIRRYGPTEAFEASMDGADGRGFTGIPLYCTELLPRHLSGEGPAVMTDGGGERPYVGTFTATDWVWDGDGYSIVVDRRVHGRPSPSLVQTFARGESGFDQVSVDVRIGADGSVTLSSDIRFDGFMSVL